MKAVFLRALEESDDKAAVLRAAVSAPAQALGRTLFEVDVDTFRLVPRSPFAYWVSDRVRSLFAELPTLASHGRTAKVGLQTSDDFRFVRMWTEVDAKEITRRWYLFAKGGKYSPYYADILLVVHWSSSGTEMKAWAGSLYGGSHWSRILKNIDHFFRPGLTWPLRTSSGLSLRAMPAGGVFGHKGPAAFVADDSSQGLLAVLAVTNSRIFSALLELQLAAADAAARSYEVGIVQRNPVTETADETASILSGLASVAWFLKRSLDTCTENSHAFHLPVLLLMGGESFGCRTTRWADHASQSAAKLAAVQAQIDDLCFDLYGVGDGDRMQIERGFSTNLAGVAGEDAEDDDGVATTDLDAAPLVAFLIAWTVGVSFGRFDIRLATGERPAPSGCDPFGPLPACSLAMLTGDDGLPVENPPPGYPVDFPRDGILVDDPGAPGDLVAACRRVFDPLFEDPAMRWDEAADVLEDRATGLRTWMARHYFEKHIKHYSRSRRKAPIYWQLATSSASYSVWLYYHRFTRDTLFRVLNDHVIPKLQHEERKLTALQQDSGPAPSAAQRKVAEAHQVLVCELRTMRDEVARVAPLWNPDLNDGVILNFAPLWRLVPQHGSWQKECKSAWDQLCKGDYDWAHLAMHLWPERVVPKCAKDRSLAIAHGLEDMFWREVSDGKWQAKAADDAVVQTLIQERTFPAVKVALNDLLSAPNALAGRQRRKKS